MTRPAVSRRFWIGTMAAVLLAATGAAAGEIEDVPFAEELEVGQTRLPLYGLGLLRYRVFFRGYVGGLYLPEGTDGEQTLADVPKALELRYFWDIDGPLFAEAADQLLARRHPPERIAQLRDRLDRFHSLYRDVKAGDRYRLAYSPGVGTTLSLNGEVLGSVPGADFARDYFGIWLGEDSLDDEFRDQLLKGR